jgi:5-methylcytosine-specific restriction endonuclease McrA
MARDRINIGDCIRCGVKPQYCRHLCKACKSQEIRDRDPGKNRAAQARYREKDPARDKAQKDAWKRREPYSLLASKQKDKARIAGVHSDLTAEDIRLETDQSGGICSYCLEPCDKLQIEHCHPMSRGGANTANNIVMACQFCNVSKLDQTPLEFLIQGCPIRPIRGRRSRVQRL